LRRKKEEGKKSGQKGKQRGKLEELRKRNSVK